MTRHWTRSLAASTALALLALAVTGSLAFADGVCAPVCENIASQYGYASPATIVTSGTTVTWRTPDDVYHSATSADWALDARIFPDDPGTAVFEVREDGLYVSTDDAPFARADGAIGLDDGAFALTYRCLFHPTLQKGVVIVTPGSP